MNKDDDNFGEVIFAYTVDDAIRDGQFTEFFTEKELTIFSSMPWKFKPGRIVLTQGVSEILENNKKEILSKGGNVKYTTYKAYLIGCLILHLKGHWGEVPKQDAIANDRAVLDDSRILSNYFIDPHDKSQGNLWIITEADRSVTTILLPSEY